MSDIGGILKKVKDGGYRRVKTVDLFDPALIEQHAALESEVQRAAEEDARRNRTPEAPKIAQQIRDLEQQIEDDALSFKVGALSFRAWSDLMAAHPPTKAQLREQSERAGGKNWRQAALDHNPETFPPALVAACAIDPEMTAEQAIELADALGPDQFEMLYSGCVEVNRGATGAPKSRAAGLILQTSGRSDDTAAPEESPDQSS